MHLPDLSELMLAGNSSALNERTQIQAKDGMMMILDLDGMPE